MAGFELTPEEIKLFLEEANEQLQTMEERLIALEEDPGNPDYIQEIFRAAHTLKGGAATAGFDNVARLTHVMESLLDQVRQGEREMSADIADVLFEGVDHLRRCLSEISQKGDARGVDVEPIISVLEEQLEAENVSPSPQGPGKVRDRAQEPVAGAGGEARNEPPVAAGDQPAREEAGGLFVIEAQIASEAAMSSVRAYQVLLVLDDSCEILASDPTREFIESGAGQVAAVRATVRFPSGGGGPEREAALEAVKRAILGIPDVVSVTVTGQAVSGAAGPASAAATMTTAEAAAAQDPASAGATRATTASTATALATAVAVPAAAAPASDGASPRTAGGNGNAAAASAASLGQTIRVDVTILDSLMNLVGELVIDRTRLAQLSSVELTANQLKEELTGVSSSLSRITTDLQDAIMQARMMPVDTLFKKFPRMIRDLSRQLGKEVDFEMSGNETELDRSVIEQIGDPLIHLLRNAIDHGIEPAEERRRAGKNPRGLVRLHAFHQENHIYIQVSDDGRGLDAEKILRKGIERGLVRPDEASRISREKIYELIFAPGFTTAVEVSSVSGRGVGMDVVKRNLEKVNGSVTVVTEEGKGTTFTIKLPLTLVIVQALMVEIAGCVMAIPLSNVTEAVQVTEADIQYARGWEMIAVRDEMVPLLNPATVWGDDWRVKPPAGKASVPVVIVRSGGSPLGLKVDRLLGEQEIVIKAMGPVIGYVPGISGASILGDGRVALIIDAAGLSKAIKQPA